MTELVRIQADENGVIRVAGSRLTLDAVVAAFDEGARNHQKYPSLALADVYIVVAYYLRHANDVRRHIDRRSRQRDGVREENERRFDSSGLRSRLAVRPAKTYRQWSAIDRMDVITGDDRAWRLSSGLVYSATRLVVEPDRWASIGVLDELMMPAKVKN